MAQLRIDFGYEFQNVGQGLFTFGRVAVGSVPEPQLRWVFDCGTLSREELITAGLSKLQNYFGTADPIDLVALSHFDKDHISGVCELLKRFPVDALMLPYVARGMRLRLAAAQRVNRGHPLHGFYDNPVRFLAALDGANIRRIVFVLPGGPPPIPGTDARRNPANSDRVDGLIVPDGPPVPEAVLETRLGGRPTAQTVMSGDPLKFRDVWEFVPYNDMTVPLRVGGPESFAADVVAMRDELRTASQGVEREDALRRLKWIYDDAFGASGRRRNEISLHLYGGPIDAAASGLSAFGSRYVRIGQRLRPLPMADLGVYSRASGILYAGDGDLSAPARMERMVACLSEERLRQVSVFQVMHHGAQKNWQEGVADRIAPDFSVFSSDPRHRKFGHPHPQVVEDFLPYTPLQVDERRHASFEGVAWVDNP